MLYKIATNTVANPLFNFSLLSRGDFVGGCRLTEYECRSEIERLIPEIPDFNVRYLKVALESSLFQREHEISTHNGKKSVPPEKIPDFWTTSPFPTISRECKDFIEGMDPDVHQFIPLTVWDGKTDELYNHTEFFTFLCGRLIEIPPHAEPILEEQTDIRGVRMQLKASNPAQMLEARVYQRIAERPEIQAILERFPIWRFNSVTYEGRPFGSRPDTYANKAFVKGAQKLGLKGFKETSPARLPKNAINSSNKTFYTYRDVSHVWY